MKAKEIMAIIVVVMCCLFFWPMTANAKLVITEIEAVVDSVDDDHGVLEGKIKTGDIINGWYSYDTSTPDSNPSISGGRYLHYTPPYGIFLSVGGFNFETDPANVDFLVEITNDYPPNDGYFLLSYSNIPLPSGVLVDYIFWYLYDPMGSALSTDALPTTPVLDEWQFNHLLITGPSLGKSFGIEGHVISAIPGAFCGDPNHPYPVGDLNQDCRVDLLDLAILASHWLENNSPRGLVTTTYEFLADKSSIIAYCGRGGISTYSIQGTFLLTVNFDECKAHFEEVDAILSKEIRFVDDYPPAKEISTESLDVLFHMTELISTNVNDTSLSFVFYKNIPTFPGADVNLRVVLQNNSALITGTFSDAVYDGCWYDLNAVAVAVPDSP